MVGFNARNRFGMPAGQFIGEITEKITSSYAHNCCPVCLLRIARDATVTNGADFTRSLLT
jgi:hypothetical protein